MALFRNAATVLSTSVVAIPLGLASSLILARYLSVHDRGAYGLAYNAATLVFVFVQLGLPTAAIYLRRREGSPAARLMTTHLFANVVTGLLGAGLVLLTPDAVRERLLPGVERETLGWTASLAFALLLAEFLRGVARALDRFDLHGWSALSLPAGFLALLLITLVWGGGGLDAALASALFVQLGVVLWLSVALLRHTGVEPRLVPDEIRAALRYGIPSHGQNLLLYLQERLEIFLVAYLLVDPVLVGTYAVALSTANPFRLIPNALSMSVFPDLAERDPRAAAHTAATLTRHSLTLTVLLCAVSLPLMPWLMPALFGKAYEAAVAPVLALLPGVCVLAASRLLARYFQAIDSQRILLVARAAGVIMLVALCFSWIPQWGITGAACASLGAGVSEMALITLAFVRMTDIGLAEIFVPRRSDLDPYRGRAERLLKRLRAQPEVR